ncbi:MAG: hypothetical protein IPK26_26950 [Planctomycetes bacterium]|nr:hypothetical protein [Planctomycetota bacterium]
MSVRQMWSWIVPTLAMPALAQQPVRLGDGIEVDAVLVAGASDLALVALWPTGLGDDPEGAAGLAAAVARWRLLALRAAWSADRPLPCGSEVRLDHVLVWLQVPVGSLDAGAKCLAAALRPPGDGATDDLAAVAIGQAALAADDAEFTIPGLRLQSLARQRLLVGAAARPLAGHARHVQVCTAGQLRAAAGQWPEPRLLAFGGADMAAVATALRTALPPVDAPLPVPIWSAPVVPPAVEDVAGYAMLMAPIAVFATPLPPPDAKVAPATALAVSILRERMSRRFLNQRRAVEESFAATPFVSGDWLAGDPVLVLCRRGIHWRPFAQPRAELEAFLAEARATAITAAELDLARRLLWHGLRTVPVDAVDASELAATPALLPARAITTAVVRFRGMQARLAELALASLSEVQSEWLRLLDPAKAWWGGLVPTQPPPDDVGPR